MQSGLTSATYLWDTRLGHKRDECGRPEWLSSPDRQSCHGTGGRGGIEALLRDRTDQGLRATGQGWQPFWGAVPIIRPLKGRRTLMRSVIPRRPCTALYARGRGWRAADGRGRFSMGITADLVLTAGLTPGSEPKLADFPDLNSDGQDFDR
jgi:hypothetical protein